MDTEDPTARVPSTPRPWALSRPGWVPCLPDRAWLPLSWGDLVLGVVPLTVLSLLYVMLVARRPETRVSALDIAVAVVPLLALTLRRRFPEAVLGVAIVSWVVAVASGDSGPGAFAPLVALYTVGSLRPWPLAVAGWAGSLVAGISGSWLAAPRTFDLGGAGEAALSYGLMFGVAAGLGLYIATRRAYTRALLERAERLERERRLLARQAVADERVRIARELHDIVAHHVSVMVLQAGGAEAVLADAAPEARSALEAIRTTGREALVDLRRMLDVLRAADDPAEATIAHAPQPVLADLDGLVERAREAGLDVLVRTDGAPVQLAAAIELSAFRLVQEALTNALRHVGGGARVVIDIRYHATDLELEVTDQGSPSGAPAALPATSGPASSPGSRAPGHGILGMRERTLLLGGEFEAGPRPGGGFRVWARIPLLEPSR